MEKKKPHYPLDQIQALVRSPRSRRITKSALDTAAQLGLDDRDIVKCVLGLGPANLYKSMTSHANPTLWQDVYRDDYDGYRLYIKLQISQDALAIVVSFKEIRRDRGAI
jgi:motility quorum-sensing regulator/GCU-specific mRNA interferase toxin